MDSTLNLQLFEKNACSKAQMIVCFRTFLRNCISQNNNQCTETNF